jgi:hypothetical protein
MAILYHHVFLIDPDFDNCGLVSINLGLFSIHSGLAATFTDDFYAGYCDLAVLSYLQDYLGHIRVTYESDQAH